MASKLSDDYLHDEAKAYELVESVALAGWPCLPSLRRTMERASTPHEGQEHADRHATSATPAARQFTVKIGTIFEDSHIPMRTWLQAIFLMCLQQEGHQQQPASPHVRHQPRSGLVHVAPACREAMRTGGRLPQMGGAGGGIVEIDETILRPRRNASQGPQGQAEPRQEPDHQLSPQERDPVAGRTRRQVRSYHVDGSTVAQVIPIVDQQRVTRSAGDDGQRPCSTRA